jgi:predicted phage terminase large subunit-like protein
MLAGAWRERLNLRELIEKVRDTCRAGKVDILVIENKAGGNWVREELMKELRDGEFIIVLDTPTVDKVARAQAVVPLFVDKMIHAPWMHEHGVWRSWVEMAISEIEKFPMGRHDDITDAVVGGLGYLRRNDLIKLAVEHDEDEREKKTFRGNQGGIANLYGVG